MKAPFFSIIIPVYNRAQFLPIALDSALNQTFDDYEVLIIDDGSTDNTPAIIKKYLNAFTPHSSLSPIRKHINRPPSLRYISQSHQGVSAARNKGVTEAQGEFICFLDSDDRFRHDKLKLTYQYIKAHPEYKIFHTEEIWYRNGQYLPQKKYHTKPSGFVFEDATKLCCISISTAAIHHDVFDAVGNFDETLPACEDYDFWLKATSQFPVFLIPYALTIKEGGHNDQQSKKYPAMDIFRIYALKKILTNSLLNKETATVAYETLVHKCYIYIKGALKRGKYSEAQNLRNMLSEIKETIQ